MKIALAMMGVFLLSACAPREPAEAPASQPAPTAASPGFVNKVWRVSESTAVTVGSVYVFLSDGTLVMTSANGVPTFGKWTRENGAFTMIEEGISYSVDILRLTDKEFRIRSHNPGEPVEIAFEPAPSEAVQ